MSNNKKNFFLFEHEQKSWGKNQLICGIDEVGRGCLAGPVVTTAVILHKNSYNNNIKDSKKLSSTSLQKLYKWLIKNCTYSIGINSARIIDQHNIYRTTQITMKQALLQLLATTPQLPHQVLVDAIPLDLANSLYSNIVCTALTQGESKSVSIAAASIIAKVTRDNLLQKLSQSFPAYRLEQHKGYATKHHRNSLHNNHQSILHRNSFLKNFIFESNHHEQQNIFC